MRSKKQLSEEEGGNVMIEFALLAPVFFMLVMGLVEFVLFQYRTYTLNHVVYEATRNLQTGEIQTSGDSEVQEAEFYKEVCKHAGPLIDCEAISFDVRSYGKLSDIDYPPVEFDDDGVPTNFVFQPGGANKYSAVRASIPHQFVTPFMAELFGMGPDMPAIVNAFCLVKNEPWT